MEPKTTQERKEEEEEVTFSSLGWLLWLISTKSQTPSSSSSPKDRLRSSFSLSQPRALLPTLAPHSCTVVLDLLHARPSGYLPSSSSSFPGDE